MSTRWQDFLSYIGEAGGDDAASAGARAFERATGKAGALGLYSSAEDKKKPGLLSKILSPLEIARGAVYATLTELGDIGSDEGFSTEDWKEKFDRARFEGEGFGSTEALSVDDDDNLLTKVGKFGGSFLADVVSDPLNWITFGGAAVGKTAATGLTKAAGKVALRELPEAVAKKTGKELGEGLVEKLAADQLRRQGAEDAAISVSRLLDEGEEGLTKLADLAELRLGDAIVTGRVRGTGRTARQYLSEVLSGAGVENAQEVAQEVIRKQSRELRGGLRVEVPFTRLGVDITQGGGKAVDAAKLGKVADLANEARLSWRKMINRPGSIKRRYSGSLGDMYGQMIHDLSALGVKSLDKPGATTAGKLYKYVEANNLATMAGDKMALAFNTAADAAREGIDAFSGDKEIATRIVNAAFDGYKPALDDALMSVDTQSEEVARLIRAGQQAREVFQEEAKALGLDPDPNYVPRIFALEQAKKNIAEDPSWNRRFDTDPAMSAKAYMELMVEQLDDDTRELVSRRMSNLEINAKRAAEGKERMFEDDMFLVLSKHAEVARARVESNELVRNLTEAGLIVKDPRVTESTFSQIFGEVSDNLRKVFNNEPVRGERIAKKVERSEEVVAKRAAQQAEAVAKGDAVRADLTAARDALRETVQSTRKAHKAAKSSVRKAQRKLESINKKLENLAFKRGAEYEKLRRAQRQARKELRNAEKRAAEARQNLAWASAEFQAAAEAPRTGAEAARISDRLPGKQRRIDARDASVIKRTADKDAAEEAVNEVTGGGGKYEDKLTELNEARDEVRKEMGDAATDAEVLRRAAEKGAARQRKIQNDLMSATHGTRGERMAAEQLDKAKASAKEVEAMVDANKAAGDVVAQNLDTINNLLAAGEDNWVEAERLIKELIDSYGKAGGSPGDIKNLEAALNAVRKLPVARKEAETRASRYLSNGLVALTPDRGQRLPQKFEGYLAGQGVVDAINAMYRVNNPNQGVATVLKDYIEPIMRIFRGYATVGRGPGYLVRNGIGATINNWLAGVKASRYMPAAKIERAVHAAMKEVYELGAKGEISPADMAKAIDTKLAEVLSFTVDENGTKAYDIVRGFLDHGVQYNRATDALERGVFDALNGRNVSLAERRATMNPTRENLALADSGIGVSRTVAGKIADSSIINDNWWLKNMANTAEREEFVVRMAAYLEGFSRYEDALAAASFSKSIHFDYRDLTEYEKNLKFIVPFYTWTRYNLPFQIRAAFSRPGTLGKFEAFAHNAGLAFGDEEGGPLPTWMEQRLGFVTGGVIGGNKLAVMMESPQLDLVKWGSTNPASIVLESINPVIKSAFEVGSGRDIDTGQEVGVVDVVRNVVPPVGTALRMFDSDRRASALLSFAGVPAATVTEKQQEGIYQRKAAEMNSKVRAALKPYLEEDEEIDGDWLVEMGRRYSPEEIIGYIKLGYGRRGNLDPNVEKKTRKKSDRPSSGTRAAQELGGLMGGYGI